MVSFILYWAKFSLIPYSVTIARAICVACSKSFEAPVVWTLKIISSATRPPINPANCSFISSLDKSIWSSLGSAIMYPPARPRGTIVTL